jgi:hypothetical protein
MRWALIALAAAIEAGTGAFLIVQPSALTWLLLGTDLSPPGVALGRIAGLALLSFGWVCWPNKTAASIPAPLPLLAYNLFVSAYLAYLGLGQKMAGPLLWPAVAFHALLSIGLIYTRSRKSGAPLRPAE